MKSKAITIVAITLGLAVGIARAQSAEPLTFRIPFAFAVGDQLLPAGEYTIRVAAMPGTLSFRSANGRSNIFIHSLPLYRQTASDKYKLVFHRYGQRYWVSEIWTAGDSTGRILQQHPSELLLAKNSGPQHVTLYLAH
jgi:hypothetical protein